MAYIEPKTDWEPDDYLTPADYNRIKNNLVFLNDMFNEEYDYYEFEPGADIGIDEFYKASKWNMFEDCVENFQRTGVVYTFGERSYYKDNGHLPNYIQLNRLEKCIEAYARQDVPVTGISISPSSLTILRGQSSTVNITLIPANATDKEVSIILPEGLSVSFNSDYSVATITAANDATGGVYSNLKFITHDGEYEASLSVTVRIPVTSVNIVESSVSVAFQDTVTLTTDVLPADATNKTLTWTSSDDNVAEVDSNGEVLAVSYGQTCKIRATSVDDPTKYDECNISTYEVLNDITILFSGTTMNVGNTKQATAEFDPSDISDKRITWGVENSSVLSINQSGLITAIGTGSSRVKVTYVADGRVFYSNRAIDVI